jgi:hypothetical protein
MPYVLKHEPQTCKKCSNCPFKSCDASTLRFLDVNSASPSARTGAEIDLRLRMDWEAARTGEKLGMRLARGQ